MISWVESGKVWNLIVPATFPPTVPLTTIIIISLHYYDLLCRVWQGLEQFLVFLQLFPGQLLLLDY